MTQSILPFRQVHLDFHTSEDIRQVASQFDAAEFAHTVAAAQVNSITCFARCHHGWLYYNSLKYPELVHPELGGRNLLLEQIEACHQLGIRVPVYTTVQWDHHAAREHPEWLIVDEKGAPMSPGFFEPGFYRSLCVNTPYREYLKGLTADMLESLPVDGMFFDIVYSDECSCRYCQKLMLESGLEPSRKADRRQFADTTIRLFMREMTDLVRSINKNCSIFYNRSHVGIFQRDVRDTHTHFELESLPSGGWGYMHFPVTIRYARTLGLDCLGQTGKFHTEWGDFHSLKNKAALEFECFRMLALNAKCMIGDQMEPRGVLSRSAYDLIGSVYQQVALREAWCDDAKPLVDIGVLNPEEFGEGMQPCIIGITRMLEESGHQFDIIDSQSDFAGYKLLVLPDHIPVTPQFADKLAEYLDNGGRMILSYESGMDPDQQGFSLKDPIVCLKKEQTLAEDGKLARGRSFERNDFADYILPAGSIAKGLHETEYVMYMKGVEADAAPGSEILAQAVLPFFNRSYKHFCSHLQAPSSGITGYAGIVRKGPSIYFAHPIFSQYDKNAPQWCKRLFLNAVELLLPEPLVKHDGPTSLLVTLNEQKSGQRYVLHLLHYIPVRKSKDIDIIEEIIPIFNVAVSLQLPLPVRQVNCVPEGISLEYSCQAGRLEFTVPAVRGYQIIEINT